MAVTMEQVERLREKSGATYEACRDALERTGGNLLDAIILLEREGHSRTAGATFTTRPGEKAAEAARLVLSPENGQSGRGKKRSDWRDGAAEVWEAGKNLLRHATVNQFEVWRRGEMMTSMPVLILALLINQVKQKKFQRVSQTILYAPHFISIMILCGMLKIFLSPYGGLVNAIAQFFGASEPINFIDSASAFRTIYIASSIWQDAGWGTIIYVATLSSVDASLHEAAKVDGANTLQRILHIDLPELVPVIVIQLIMSFGNLMNVGFEKAFLLQTSLNKETSEIIATYVYEQGMLKSMYSFSTAVGLFNTVVNIVLLFVVSKICKRLSNVSFI